MISIAFQVETEYGVYSDAIVLPTDHTFTDADIAAMKQQRVTNWLAILATPAEETSLGEVQ